MERTDIEHVPTTTPDLTAERLDQLRELFPEAFTEGKVDFDKLRAALGDFVDDRPERYSFTWAGKRDAIRLLQTPSRATLVPAPEESINWDTTQHVFIEGENLEVLKLLYKAYFGKVKLIYIDPPYNTGKEFIYPDNYADPLDLYLQLTGQRDAEGNLLTSNTETSGKYHSSWLSMMYPRLVLSRQLLRPDGLAMISIGYHEVHHLRTLMNEIYGEENFLALCTWRGMHTVRNSSKHFNTNTEYVLVFARDVSTLFGASRETWLRVPRDKEGDYGLVDNNDKGPYKLDPLHARNYYAPFEFEFENGLKWSAPEGRYPAYSPGTLRTMESEGDIVFPGDMLQRVDGSFTQFNGSEPMMKRHLKNVLEGVPPDTLLPSDEVGFSLDGTKELDALFNAKVFDQPKPTRLLKYLLSIESKRGRESGEPSIIVDFFAGSATTAHAALLLNAEDGIDRRYVLVQLPEPIKESHFAFQAGFRTVSEISIERIRRAARRISVQATDSVGLVDTGFRVFKLSPSTLRTWQGTADATPKQYAAQLDWIADSFGETWQPLDMVWEIAIKEGFPLTSSVTQAAAAGQLVYRVRDADSDRVIHVCLDDAVTAELAPALDLTAEDLLVVRDTALDDTTAANLALQCRLKSI